MENLINQEEQKNSQNSQQTEDHPKFKEERLKLLMKQMFHTQESRRNLPDLKGN